MAAEEQGTGPHSPNAAKTAAELLYSIVDAANVNLISINTHSFASIVDAANAI